MKPARAMPSRHRPLEAKIDDDPTKKTVATSARLAALRQVGGRFKRSQRSRARFGWAALRSAPSACGRCARGPRRCRRRCRGASSALALGLGHLATQSEGLASIVRPVAHRDVVGEPVEGRARAPGRRARPRGLAHAGRSPRRRPPAGPARWSSTLMETCATPPRAASSRPIARTPAGPPRRPRGCAPRSPRLLDPVRRRARG